MRLHPLILRFLLSLGVLSSFVWAFWFQKGDVGSFIEIKDGTTHVSAGTNPRAVAMGLSMMLIYFVLLNTRAKEHKFSVAPIWRRAAAFAVDFWFALFALSALFGCIDVLLEAFRTGTFRWNFERDYWVASDSLSAALVLLFLAALVAYFLLPLMHRGQTVGAWIFRLATVNSDGCIVYLPFSVATRRLRAEFRGLRYPLNTIRKRDEQGRTFYDIESGFTVVSY
jgi:RDD family protein